MLSYLHAFHAGNHADILKHITLIQILRHLNAKDAPYSFFDTHAGSALYSLEGAFAEKTAESKRGVLGLRGKDAGDRGCVPEPIRFYLELIEPYLGVACYPGSPLIERALMRADCHLSLCELHPEEVKKLRENIEEKNSFFQVTVAGNSNSGMGQKKCPVKIYHEDGLRNLFATTPPLIRRGAVLIDPAYEEKNEFNDVANTVCRVHKKWSAGIIAIWFPLLANKKNQIEKMISQITAAAKAQNANTAILRAEFLVDKEDAFAINAASFDGFRSAEMRAVRANQNSTSAQGALHLYGSGMLVINAPWKLDEQLKASLDFLCGAIYQDANPSYCVTALP